MNPKIFKTPVFLGTPDFAATILEGLLARGQVFSQVITMPNKPQGRGHQMTEPAVKHVAKAHNIPVYQPENAKQLMEFLAPLNPDLLLVIAYGMLLPAEIVHRYLIVNLHASLLPKYRGASPIQAAILNGDKVTGVTLMRIAEKLDNGNIITSQEVPIQKQDNTVTLSARLQSAGIELLNKQLSTPLNQWHFTPQQSTEATYCPKIKKENGLVDLATDEPEAIIRKIQAYTPWPGVFVIHKGKRVKIVEASMNTDGKLEIQKVQAEGRPAMNYKDFVNGYGVLI